MTRACLFLLVAAWALLVLTLGRARAETTTVRAFDNQQPTQQTKGHA